MKLQQSNQTTITNHALVAPNTEHGTRNTHYASRNHYETSTSRLETRNRHASARLDLCFHRQRGPGHRAHHLDRPLPLRISNLEFVSRLAASFLCAARRRKISN